MKSICLGNKAKCERANNVGMRKWRAKVSACLILIPFDVR